MSELDHGEEGAQDITNDRGLIDREIEAASREAVASLVTNADRDALTGALTVAGSGHLDPRFVRRGADRLLHRRLSRLSRGDAIDIAGRLGRSMLAVVREPTEDDRLSGEALQAAIPKLLERWSPGAIRLELAFLTTTLDEETSAAARRLLEEDRRLEVATVRPRRTRPIDLDAGRVAGENNSDGSPGVARADEDPDLDDPIRVEDEVDADDDAPSEDDASLFTAIDQVLIKQVVASYTGVVGALTVDDVQRLVDELVRLNTDRHASFFHLGFLDGLDDSFSPDLPVEVMNVFRRQWYAFGKLTGLVRRQRDDAILELARSSQEEIEQIVRHPSQGRSVTAPLIRVLLGPKPTHAAELLRLRLLGDGDFVDLPSVLHMAHQRARVLLLDQRPDEAEALWYALAFAPQDLLRQLSIAPSPRLISCARARNDFPTALERVTGFAEYTVDPHERAILETERGLIASEVSHLRVVSLGSTDTHRRNLAARLARGRHHFEKALELDRNEWRASLCLGVLLALDNEPEPAAPLLEQARSALLNDPLAASTQFGSEVQFLAALVRLRCLDEGTDGRAFKDIADALATDAWSPSVNDLIEAIELLTLHGSRHSAQFLTLASHYVPAPRLAPAAIQLLHNGESAAAPTAARIARSAKVDARTRIELLTLALDATWNQPVQEIEPLVDQLDDLLREVADDDAERTLQTWLATSMVPIGLYGGFGVDQLRILLHERLGEFETARELLERLIHRSLAAPAWERPYDLADLLDHHRRRDVDGERSDALAALITSDASQSQTLAATSVERRTVRLLFVGGDERQQRITAQVEERLRQDLPGTVEVTWIHPGWSARWPEHAERAEAVYDHTDALVLMPLVRTNLGRRLRRSSGEAGIPWVACTGRGVDSIARSLFEATRVVRSVTS